jgi:hypothetical protein
MPNRPESTAFPLVPLPKVYPPERFEDAQGFRETFLLFVTDPALNGALRVLGATAFDMVLEFNRHWPHLPGILTPWEMQAALGDLRSLQGFLAQVGRGREDHSPADVDAELSALAEVEARNLGAMGDRIEAALFGKRDGQ